MIQADHDELPAEFDFTHGVRGKFQIQGLTQRLNLPVYLDEPLQARLSQILILTA